MANERERKRKKENKRRRKRKREGEKREKKEGKRGKEKEKLPMEDILDRSGVGFESEIIRHARDIGVDRGTHKHFQEFIAGVGLKFAESRDE